MGGAKLYSTLRMLATLLGNGLVLQWSLIWGYFDHLVFSHLVPISNRLFIVTRALSSLPFILLGDSRSLSHRRLLVLGWVRSGSALEYI